MSVSGHKRSERRLEGDSEFCDRFEAARTRNFATNRDDTDFNADFRRRLRHDRRVVDLDDFGAVDE